MTVANSTARVSYAGDGASTSFAVPFYFLADADLRAVHRDVGGTETIWANGVHYTLSGAGNLAGGTLTVNTAPTDHTPATGETLTILRDVAVTQDTDLTEGDPLPAATLETALDKLTMIAQQITEALARAVTLAKSSSLSGLEVPEPEALKLLGWNTAGTSLSNYAAADVPLSAVTAFIEGLLNDADSDEALATLTALKDVMTTRGDLTYEGVSGPARLGVGTNGQVLKSDGTDPIWGSVTFSQPRNLILDPDFRVTPEATSMTAATTPANSDDTYFNQVLLLSDGDDTVDLSVDTSVTPTGAYASLKADVQTASKKFGFLFPIERRDAAEILGGVASAAFEARTTTGAAIENIRVGILAWDGAADTITSDVVSAWNGEGTDPTLAANWIFENVPTNIAVTADSFAEIKVENVAIDTSGAKNVALFIWVDDADAAINDVLYISKVRFTEGPVASNWRPRAMSEEQQLFLRLLNVMKDDLQALTIGNAHLLTTNDARIEFIYPVEMRVTPTLSFSSASDFNVAHKATLLPVVSFSAAVRKQAIQLNAAVSGTPFTVGESGYLHTSSQNAWIKLDARL